MLKLIEGLMALATPAKPKTFRDQARIVAARYDSKLAVAYLLAVAREMA